MFWKDKQALFSTKAEEWAKKISDDGNEKMNNPTQIRKFYDEVVRFDGRLKEAGANVDEEFVKLLPYIHMLKAKTAYAHARELVSDSFKKFLDDCISNVKNKEDFKAFAGHFEAFMGYHKYYFEKDKKDKKEKQGGRR